MWYMNEERELVRQAAREFAEKEVKPAVHSMEVEHKFPTELVKRMGELGFSGWLHKKEHGGSDGDWVTFGLILEEIGKYSTTLPVELMLQSTLCSAPIALLGTQEQIDKWIKPVFEGKKVMAVSHTEPVGITQVPRFQSRAHFDEETNEWVINASKIFTTGAGEADIYVVDALVKDFDPATGEGLSQFVVAADTPGVRAGHIENKLGWNGSSTGAMIYDNVRVPPDQLIGEPGKAMTDPRGRVSGDWEPLTFGPMSLGAAEGAYERALAYVKARKQDDGTIFSNHQVVRHQLARMWLAIEQFRGYCYTTLAWKDSGQFTVPRAMGMKILGADLMQFVGREAVMLCGGQGVVIENGFEMVYRDGLVNGMGGGSNTTFTDVISNIVTN